MYNDLYCKISIDTDQILNGELREYLPLEEGCGDVLHS